MILAPQLLQYIIVQYASRPLRITIYNCTNSVLGVGGRVGGNVRGQGSVRGQGDHTVRVDG